MLQEIFLFLLVLSAYHTTALVEISLESRVLFSFCGHFFGAREDNNNNIL